MPNPFVDGKIFGREPTLFIAAIGSALSILGTLGFAMLDPEQAGLWVVVLNAILGVVNAAVVRPISPVAFTYLIGAAVALGASYGLELPAETVYGINAAVVPILALLSRGQVSPNETAVSSGKAPTPPAIPPAK